jgi:PAS domain-containing protein
VPDDFFDAESVATRLAAEALVVELDGYETHGTRDAFERDRALAEATAERQRLYDVFMQAPAAIAVLEGPEHRFTVANARYRELVGGREVVGRAVIEALPEIRCQGFV